MLHLKGFVKYIPKSPLPDDFPMECLNNPNIEDLARRHCFAEMAKEKDGGRSVLFEHDKNGLCWYDALLQFQKDTVKIVYNPATGQVLSFDSDAAKLFPHGNNVLEVKSVPKGFESGTWKVDIDDFKIGIYDKAVVEKNKLFQTRALESAVAHLYVLNIMEDKQPHEVVEQQALREFVIKMKRVDLSDVEPKWPTSLL